MRLLLSALAASVIVSVAGSADAATTTCKTVAACVMGTNSSSGPGVAGTSSSGFGLSGISKSGHGVNGTSSTSFGVVGITTQSSPSAPRAGVLGEDKTTNNDNNNNSGVAGTSEYGIGVSAKTTYGTALVAESIHGEAFSAEADDVGDAIYAHAKWPGTGLIAEGATGVGATGYDNGLVASGPNYGITSSSSGTAGLFSGGSESSTLMVQSLDSGTAPTLQITGADSSKGILIDAGGAKSDAMVLDSEGNEMLAGTLTQKGSSEVRTHSSAGADVASYGARSASPTLEDFGTGQLHNGAATVALDRTFASTIDSRSYLVFVTPHGNSNGLYTQSSPTGFTVRENNGGRSGVSFDYRIVAKPLDAKAAHLPTMGSFPHLAKRVAVPALRKPYHAASRKQT